MKVDNGKGKSRYEIDRALDEALAVYTSAEPRAGLEERILANLHTVNVREAGRRWWNWRIATVLAATLLVTAATLLVTAALVWRWNRPTHEPIVLHPSAPNTKPVTSDLANDESDSGATPNKAVRRNARRPMPHEIVAANPKLDVFPSPLPLSEQEKILASYIAQYPEHAALVAVARMDALRQEAEVRQEIAAETDARQ